MYFLYRNVIFVSTVFVLSLKPFAANSLRTRNGTPVGQPIDRCVQSVSNPGQYLLHPHIGRQWSLQDCTLYIRSPFKTRVRLTFTDLNLNCFTSTAKVIDGFNFLDSHKRKVYSLPDDASDQKRQLDLCRTRQSEQPKVVELSQNAGQISYNLAKSNSILVNVEFIPVEPTCNVILSGELDGQYVLSNNGHAGDCRWYVTGAVVLTLDEMHLSNDADSCAQASSNFAVRSSSIGWNKSEMTINKIACGTHNRKAELLVPCKYTRLELHTSDDSLQWVKFRLRLAGDAEKEPGTYYCH